MITTAVELRDLLAEVNEATKLLQRSKPFPNRSSALIDSFESTLGAATPSRVEADPYLTAALWAATFRAQRRCAMTTPRSSAGTSGSPSNNSGTHCANLENQPYSDDAPIRDILARTLETVAAPQKTLAELLGVSVRQLQRWLAADGP